MTNRFGFNLGDYNTEEVNKNNNFRDIVPEKMRNAKRWLLWRSEKDKGSTIKFRKVPYYADGTFRRGTLDTDDDLSRLVTYDEAIEVLSEKDFTGLGFALGRDGEGYWQGIDLDNVKEHNNDSLADRLPGYVEASPSGNGVHAIGYGEYFRGKNRSGEQGWEYYSRAKYFTFTGNAFRNGEIVDLKPFIKRNIDKDLADDETERKSSVGQLILTPSQIEDIERALRFIDSDCPRDTWLQIGFSLARVPNGYQLFYDWSKRSRGIHHAVASDTDIEDQWNDVYANSRGEISLGTLYHYAAKNPDFQFTEVSEEVKEIASTENDPLIIDVEQWSGAPITPDWVINEFIGEGVRVISGATGKGKTSIIAPLCANVAHLLEYNFLTPRHRRVVFYFTEDTNQLNRMIMGMKKHQSKEFETPEEKEAEWRHYFQIKLTKRYKVNQIKKLAEAVREHTNEQDGKIIQPLVVFDTQAASLDVEDENNNAELSKFISAIKLYFWESNRIPVWIVTHITKMSAENDDYSSLTSRGAGSVAADCHGTMGIVHPKDFTGRILGNIKDRDGASRKEVRAEITQHVTQALTPYGEPDTLSYYTTEYFESDPNDRAVIKAEAANDQLMRKVYTAIHELEQQKLVVTLELLANQKLGGHRDKIKSVLIDLEKMGRIYQTNPADLTKEQRKDLNLSNRAGLFYKVLGTYIG